MPKPSAGCRANGRIRRRRTMRRRRRRRRKRRRRRNYKYFIPTVCYLKQLPQLMQFKRNV
jgi:hypothetical protein